MRVSLRRPARRWAEAVLHPREAPFPRGSVVQTVEIDYPERDARASGSGSWLVYWLVVSLIAAFCLRPWLKVNI